jgi:hypothetical protein
MKRLLRKNEMVDKREKEIIQQKSAGAQTDSLEMDTQKDFLLGEDMEKDYESAPWRYWKYDATSDRKKHHLDMCWFKPKQKNDATSETFDTANVRKDSTSQTSRYIPGSLNKKVDNINQTIRYELKKIFPR